MSGAVSEFDPAAAEIDVTKPNVARVYDYLLGGKESFPADKEQGDLLMRNGPASRDAALHSRAFLGRVVERAAAAGIWQFLDIGSGLPTQQNVHEVAHRVAPGSRVVYVDYDPAVVKHTKALLTGNAWAIQADIRDPRQILDHPDAQYPFLNWDEPMLILLVSVLHFVTDDWKPGEIVRRLAAAAAPGSWVAIAHGTDEGSDPEKIRRAQKLYDGASAPWVPRRPEKVAEWLEGMRIFPPGRPLPVSQWWPRQGEDTAATIGVFGVVAEVTPGRPAPDAG